jgi:hypothetical protein
MVIVVLMLMLTVVVVLALVESQFACAGSGHGVGGCTAEQFRKRHDFINKSEIQNNSHRSSCLIE